jgi:hypothetical protein
VVTSLGAGQYSIAGVQSGKVLDVTGASDANGAQVDTLHQPQRFQPRMGHHPQLGRILYRAKRGQRKDFWMWWALPPRIQPWWINGPTTAVITSNGRFRRLDPTQRMSVQIRGGRATMEALGFCGRER